MAATKTRRPTSWGDVNAILNGLARQGLIGRFRTGLGHEAGGTRLSDDLHVVVQPGSASASDGEVEELVRSALEGRVGTVAVSVARDI